jgi:hypothetical protein
MNEETENNSDSSLGLGLQLSFMQDAGGFEIPSPFNAIATEDGQLIVTEAGQLIVTEG